PARHQVCFFYLRTGDDIARVELPQWVADDDLRVQLLHATLVDQCRRCDGYPRALQEAHEQAVISVGDRQQFANMVELLAAPLGLRPGRNGKAASKRSRAL
ncbi:MAG: DNA double-strand break repair nuclease NurA, partial [Dehalococcoidia bacterium]